MGRILDRFGIYDIIAVLLTGVGICTVSQIILRYCFQIELIADFSFYDTLPFLVVSYLVGILFQETSNWIQRLVFPDNALLKKALVPFVQSNLYMTKGEIDGVREYIKKAMWTEESEDLNDNVLYNVCKFYVIQKKDTAQIDRNQSLSSMSRSLSLYFAILSLGAYIYTLIRPDYISAVVFVGAILLSWLLYKRYVRFAVLRYVLIIRMFLYDVVLGVGVREYENEKEKVSMTETK